MKVHLGINNIYAAKRCPEPEEWGRQVTQRWGLKYVSISLFPHGWEGVKKSACAVIPSEARNLALSSVRKGKKTERDSSLRSE